MSGMEIPLILGAVSAGATVAGTVASAGAQEKGKQASLMAAQEQSNAQNFEAGQYDLQAKRIRNAAAADEAARRIDLESSLQTIDAMRAGRGLALDSPTGRAISQNVTATGERNIQTSRTNLLLQADQSDAQAELSRRKARYSLLAGDAAASAADDQIAATYAGGLAKVASIGTSFYKTPAVR